LFTKALGEPTFTRSFFTNFNKTLDEFLAWKYDNGFDVYVELADKLSPLGLWGMDLRNAVRERLRLYNRQAKLR
jgi:hypothetical protein